MFLAPHRFFRLAAPALIPHGSALFGPLRETPRLAAAVELWISAAADWLRLADDTRFRRLPIAWTLLAVRSSSLRPIFMVTA